MKALTPALAFAAALLVTLPVSAQHQTFAIDPNASDVKMTLKTSHEVVYGSFHLESGSIVYDQSATTISGSVVVAAASGKTGNGIRDKKMDKDILKVQQYTTVSFIPKIYTGTIASSGDSAIQVSGVLTLLGTPHDITVPMQVHIDGTSCTAKAHFIIPYVQWGLKNPSFMIWKADNDVAIDLSLTGHLSSSLNRRWPPKSGAP
jgi:polyisoprenoid-binding protein YceI